MKSKINNEKTALLTFLKWKNEQIKKHVKGINYITKDDLDEIKNWSLSLCKDIWRLQLNVIKPEELAKFGFYDSATCPWCLQRRLTSRVSCIDCGYGIRHGKCISHLSSKYQKLLQRIRSIGDFGIAPNPSINSLIGNSNVKNKIFNLDAELRQNKE